MIDRHQLQTIAETIDTNGGWHIAALKIMEAAGELDRLRARLEEARLLLMEARQWEKKGYPVMRDRIDKWNIEGADDEQFT
jgi:hypothetical protein